MHQTFLTTPGKKSILNPAHDNTQQYKKADAQENLFSGKAVAESHSRIKVQADRAAHQKKHNKYLSEIQYSVPDPDKPEAVAYESPYNAEITAAVVCF